MPSKQQLPQFISKSMDVLESKIGQFEVAMRQDLEQDTLGDKDEAIAILQQKLAEAQEIITEQDQLIQASLINQPVGSIGGEHRDRRILHAADEQEHKQGRATVSQSRRSGYDSQPTGRLDAEVVRLQEMEEDLAIQKRELERKLQNVDQERQLLRDQAMNLDQDRLEFEVREVCNHTLSCEVHMI